MPNTKDNPSPMIKLNRFLYLLSEEPRYISGDPHVHKYFEKGKLTAIQTLIEDQVNKAELHLLLPAIVKAANDSTCPRKDAAIFALAECIRSPLKSLQTEAYKLLNQVCKTSDELFMFVKFFIRLSDHKGFGAGFRKCISKWYFSLDEKELAELVTTVRGRCGWKHKDIFKMIHIKSPKTAVDTILTYVIKGLQEAESKTQYPGSTEILEHFKIVEMFKICEDPVKISQIIQQYHLKLEHVPTVFIKCPEVWNVIIPTLPLPTILDLLPRLSNFGLLKPNSPVLNQVLNVLNNPENVKNSGIHPIKVLIALRNYESNGKCPDHLKLQYRQEMEAKKQQVGGDGDLAGGDAATSAPPQRQFTPVTSLVNALNKVLNLSFHHPVKIGVSYMISIDNRDHMNDKCFKCGNVTAYQAAVTTLLSLFKTQKDIVIAVFNDRGVHIVNLDKGISLKDAETRVRNIKSGHIQFQKPFDWAEKKKKQIDVFINIYHSGKLSFQLPREKRQPPNYLRNSLENYRKKIHPPAKLISMNLCSAKSTTATGIPGMIDICGFDEYVPKIIESVANGSLQ